MKFKLRRSKRQPSEDGQGGSFLAEHSVSDYLKPLPHPGSHGSWSQVPLGVDTSGNLVEWDLRKDGSLLVLGKAGAGKTTALANVIYHAATQKNWRLVAVNFEKTDLFRFTRSFPPGCEGRLVLDPELVLPLLREAAEELRMRRWLVATEGVSSYRELSFMGSEPYLIAMDNFELFHRLARAYNGLSEPDTEEINLLVHQLAREGGKYGIYLAVGSMVREHQIKTEHRPLATDFSGKLLLGDMSFRETYATLRSVVRGREADQEWLAKLGCKGTAFLSGNTRGVWLYRPSDF